MAAPDELQSYQNKCSSAAVHARQHVSIRSGWRPCFATGLGRFNDILILTRAQAQANVKALASVDLPPHVGGVARKSGGLSGRRTVFPVTARLLEKLHCVDQRL